jgi:hypothetical protein
MIEWVQNSGTAFASDLGWTPGVWPERFEAKGPSGLVTETFRKVFVHRGRDGEVSNVEYTAARSQVTRPTLIVFND